MANNQSFKPKNTNKDVVYYAHAYAADDYDLTITETPGDPSAQHAKVELVFFQDKGSDKREVVAAIRMQLYELEGLAALIQEKKGAFLKK